MSWGRLLLLCLTASGGHAARKQATSLQKGLRSDRYRAILAVAYRRLVQFAASRDLPLPAEVSHSRSGANRLLIDYAQMLYDQGAAMAHATHAILEIQYKHPRCRGRLQPAWDSIVSW